MLLVRVGAYRAEFAVHHTGFVAQIIGIHQRRYGCFYDLGYFGSAGFKCIGVGDGTNENTDAKIGASHHVVQLTQDRDIVPTDAHLFLGLAQGGIKKVPVFRVSDAAREGNFPFVVLNFLRAFVE